MKPLPFVIFKNGSYTAVVQRRCESKDVSLVAEPLLVAALGDILVATSASTSRRNRHDVQPQPRVSTTTSDSKSSLQSASRFVHSPPLTPSNLRSVPASVFL